MQLLKPFDANQFDPTQTVGNLPIGKHPVVIESSEVKANKNNDGGFLQLNLRITDGPQQGATGAYRLNLYHNNQQTVEIAHKQLSAICHVIGVYQLTDSNAMHNIPFIVEVGPQKNDPAYTEVKKVFDAEGNEPTRKQQGGGQQQQPQQQQQSNGSGWGGQQQQPQQGGGWQQQQGNTNAPPWAK